MSKHFHLNVSLGVLLLYPPDVVQDGHAAGAGPDHADANHLGEVCLESRCSRRELQWRCGGTEMLLPPHLPSVGYKATERRRQEEREVMRELGWHNTSQQCVLRIRDTRRGRGRKTCSKAVGGWLWIQEYSVRYRWCTAVRSLPVDPGLHVSSLSLSPICVETRPVGGSTHEVIKRQPAL